MSTILMNEATATAASTLNIDLIQANLRRQSQEPVVQKSSVNGPSTEILLARIHQQIAQAKDQCFRLRYYLDEIKA